MKIEIKFDEYDRGTGRTTRLVDDAIQRLFNKEPVLVVDHFNHPMANNYLLERIEGRLHNEHPRVMYEVKRHVGLDYYIIKLI